MHSLAVKPPSASNAFFCALSLCLAFPDSTSRGRLFTVGKKVEDGCHPGAGVIGLVSGSLGKLE